jgi:hypothetical protein
MPPPLGTLSTSVEWQAVTMVMSDNDVFAALVEVIGAGSSLIPSSTIG